MARRAWFVLSVSVSSALAILAACTGDDPVTPFSVSDGSPPPTTGDSAGNDLDANGSSSSSGGALDASDASSEPSLCERPSIGKFERVVTHQFYAGHEAAAATKDGWVVAGHLQANQGIPFSYDYDAGLLVDAGDKTEFATVVRFGPSREVLWQKAFGGNSSEEVRSVVVDESDDVYISGWSWSDSLPIGTKTVAQGGLHMGFVAKLSGKTGETIWAQSFADGQYWYGYGCGGLDYQSGHLVVACSMGKTQSYVSKTGTKSLAGADDNGTSIYSLDVNTGEALWARPLSSGTGTSYSWVESVDVSANFVVLAGIFDGPKLASNDVDIALTKPGGMRSGFVLELSLADGSLHFGKAFGGATATDNVTVAFAAGASDNGGVFLSAAFQGAVSLGGSANVESKGQTDLFLAWLNNKQGAPEWVKAVGGPENESVNEIRVDPCGRPTLLTTIESVLDKIDDASVPAPQNSASHAILKLDTAGRLLWAQGTTAAAGADSNIVLVNGIGLHPKTGETRVVGQFTGKIDFGNGELTDASPSFNPFFYDLGP